MVRYIHCEDIVVEPVILTLGDTIQVDATQVSAYDSVRVLQMIQQTKTTGSISDSAAGAVVLDIIRAQNPDISDADITKQCTQLQLEGFVIGLSREILRTHASMSRGDIPLEILRVLSPPPAQTET